MSLIIMVLPLIFFFWTWNHLYSQIVVRILLNFQIIALEQTTVNRIPIFRENTWADDTIALPHLVLVFIARPLLKNLTNRSSLLRFCNCTSSLFTFTCVNLPHFLCSQHFCLIENSRVKATAKCRARRSRSFYLQTSRVTGRSCSASLTLPCSLAVSNRLESMQNRESGSLSNPGVIHLPSFSLSDLTDCCLNKCDDSFTCPSL